MATILPFRAVRPTRDKACMVSTRSYHMYRGAERKIIMKYNPYSFLHILMPGFKFKKKFTGDVRFKLVSNRYNEFKEEGTLVKDEHPNFYLHQKSFEGETFWGIIAIASLEDYENDVIKKHEKTLKDREELFGHYLDITGFNAEPVLLTYPDHPDIDAIYNKYRSQRPEYEFSTNKKRLHKLWLINDEKDIDTVIKSFSETEKLYIADGHHRTASSNYLRKIRMEKNPNHAGNEAYNFFMSYLIPESNLKISAFNRFVKKLPGIRKEEFLISLDEFFRIENLGHRFYSPSRKHHFSMYFQKEFYKLYLRSNRYECNNALDDLDPEVLWKTVLHQVLKIKDLSHAKNIGYLPQILNENQLQDEVDSGKYEVGFGLFPVSVKQLKAVADANLVMPPKSTYVEPKLRSGLTIYEIDE